MLSPSWLPTGRRRWRRRTLPHPCRKQKPRSRRRNRRSLMSSRRFIGVFEREQDTLDAIRASRARGFRVVDVYSPYAVHGIDDAMGLGPSRIPWIVFALGLAGAALKVWFEFWTTAVDWPINVGG